MFVRTSVGEISGSGHNIAMYNLFGGGGGGVIRYPVPKWLHFLDQCGEWFFTASVFFSFFSYHVAWRTLNITLIYCVLCSVMFAGTKRRGGGPGSKKTACGLWRE